ncbi:unnamed protein product [Hermetia illucens]|uniref:Uncharacterized protein n=1 Tax=Hermetia illucens TaxID=343691 RepID=A0A7R8V6C0_HERIL|nr:unnamed protein product [Hermetia illucens]
MSKRQVDDRSVSPEGMDPEPKRIHPYGDSEGEAPSSPEGSREFALEDSRQSAPEDSELIMALESTDDDEDDVVVLRRQVQELKTSLKEMTSRYDRLSALFSSSLTQSTIALTNTTPQYNTPGTSANENREERSPEEITIPKPSLLHKPVPTTTDTTSPQLTVPPMKAAHHPTQQLQQPSTHTPTTTTTTTSQAAQSTKPNKQEPTNQTRSPTEARPDYSFT